MRVADEPGNIPYSAVNQPLPLLRRNGGTRSSIFFFFSSRRRHTRWTGDWSSDVCSSDLEACEGAMGERGDEASLVAAVAAGDREARSEERRVGKECRSRWGAEPHK